jgi:hypothetical protein
MLVVTLVHGTWGRGVLFLSEHATWTTDTSPLCKALRDRFGSELEFRRFPWSGGNSHAARSRAALDLRDYLQDGLDRWPAATHIVIAHSHGGNVALSALADPDLQGKVAGVACLATPFLMLRERDLGQNPWKGLAGALVVIMILLFWLLDHVLLPDSWPAIGRFAIIVGVSALLMGAVVELVRKWRKFAERLRRDLPSPTVDPDKLLIVRSPADEASGALALFQFISQLTVRAYVWTQSLYERVEAEARDLGTQKIRVLMIAACAFLSFAGAVVVTAGLSWETGDWSWIHVAVIAGIVVFLYVSAGALYLFLGWADTTTVMFRLAASAVVWPVIGLLSVLLLPFGKEMAMANILLDVTAETTPPGSWMVHLIEPPTSKELGKDMRPLMHCMVCENPRVLGLLSRWIAKGSEGGVSSR